MGKIPKNSLGKSSEIKNYIVFAYLMPPACLKIYTVWYLFTVLKSLFYVHSSLVVCVEKPRLTYLYIKLRISTHLVEFWKGSHKVGTQFIILLTAPSNMEISP